MAAAWDFLRQTPRLFSALRRCGRAAGPRRRTVRFRPVCDAVEHRTLLSTAIPLVSTAGSAFIGDFDGLTDLVTVNPRSNDVTMISDYGGRNPVTTTISSGGVDPSVGFAFNTGRGYEDLVVGNTGDGVLALFAGSPNGLTLESSMNVPDLRRAVDLVVSRVTSNEVGFFMLLQSQIPGVPETDGPYLLFLGDSAAGAPQLVFPDGTLALSGQSSASLPRSSGVAQLVPLQESSLALIGTLLPLSSEAPAAAPPAAGETGAPVAAGPTTGAAVSLGQPLLDRGNLLAAAGALDGQPQPLVPREQPAAPGNAGAAGWQRYTLGTGDAIEQFDREHPALFGTSALEVSSTSSRSNEDEGRNGVIAGTVLSENSAATPAQAAVREVADDLIGLLGHDDSRAGSSGRGREGAAKSAGLRLAGTRSDLSASLVLTTVAAGCVYFSPAGQRARANVRRNGATRRPSI